MYCRNLMLSHATSLSMLLFFFFPCGLWPIAAFSLFEISFSSLVYSRLASTAARLYSTALHISLLLHPTMYITIAKSKVLVQLSGSVGLRRDNGMITT